MSDVLGEVKKTERGFQLIEFRDRNDCLCALQVSSLAEYKKPGTSAVWLGVKDVKPMIMAQHAIKLGIKTNTTCGWVDYEIPKEVLLHAQMHLNREQVEALVQHLTRWLEKDKF